jgi:hypothetical protein
MVESHTQHSDPFPMTHSSRTSALQTCCGMHPHPKEGATQFVQSLHTPMQHQATKVAGDVPADEAYSHTNARFDRGVQDEPASGGASGHTAVPASPSFPHSALASTVSWSKTLLASSWFSGIPNDRPVRAPQAVNPTLAMNASMAVAAGTRGELFNVALLGKS